MLSIEKFGRNKTEVKEKVERMERPALRNKVKEEEHSDIYGGRDEIGMKTYMHGAMDYTKTLKLRFRVGHLDLPKRGGAVLGDRWWPQRRNEKGTR